MLLGRIWSTGQRRRRVQSLEPLQSFPWSVLHSPAGTHTHAIQHILTVTFCGRSCSDDIFLAALMFVLIDKIQTYAFILLSLSVLGPLLIGTQLLFQQQLSSGQGIHKQLS